MCPSCQWALFRGQNWKAPCSCKIVTSRLFDLVRFVYRYMNTACLTCCCCVLLASSSGSGSLSRLKYVSKIPDLLVTSVGSSRTISLTVSAFSSTQSATNGCVSSNLASLAQQQYKSLHQYCFPNVQDDKLSFDAYHLEQPAALLSMSGDQTEPIPCMAQELELQARQLEEQHLMQIHDRCSCHL